MFNLSHAACYALLSVYTAWLKCYYPAQFMAAILSMTADDKIPDYLTICEKKMGLKIMPPDVNLSGKDFTPHSNQILYGLTAIKGIGETSIPDIMANAPYDSLEDAQKRLPKKSFNKRIAESLIKAGAFDFDDPNRNRLLNNLHVLRKDKGIEPLDEDEYDDKTIMQYEEEALGTHVSVHTWWEQLGEGVNTTLRGVKVKSVAEKADKKGRLMAFPQMEYEGETFKSIVFSSIYANSRAFFDKKVHPLITVNGKKDERGTFIIKDIAPYIDMKAKIKAGTKGKTF